MAARENEALKIALSGVLSDENIKLTIFYISIRESSTWTFTSSKSLPVNFGPREVDLYFSVCLNQSVCSRSMKESLSILEEKIAKMLQAAKGSFVQRVIKDTPIGEQIIDYRVLLEDTNSLQKIIDYSRDLF